VRIRFIIFIFVSDIEHSDDAGRALAGPTASSAARMPGFQHEQRARPVLNGRPSDNFGPPVGLFHPAFNCFSATMKSSERLPEAVAAHKYPLIRELFQAAASIYSEAKERMNRIRDILTTIIGRPFISTSASGVEADSVIFKPCGNCMAYSLVLEGKNEIGTGAADPYNQACLSYRKYWAQNTRKWTKFRKIYLLLTWVSIRSRS
jgi:hypothetical protein